MAQLKNDSKEVRIGLEEIVCHFQELEDPREPINIHHPLESVIVIALAVQKRCAKFDLCFPITFINCSDRKCSVDHP